MKILFSKKLAGLLISFSAIYTSLSVQAAEKLATSKSVRIQADNLNLVDEQVRELTARLNDLTLFMYISSGILLISLIVFVMYFLMNYNHMSSTIRKLRLKNDALTNRIALQNEKLMSNMLSLQRNLGDFTEKQMRMSSDLKDLKLNSLKPSMSAPATSSSSNQNQASGVSSTSINGANSASLSDAADTPKEATIEPLTSSEKTTENVGATDSKYDLDRLSAEPLRKKHY